jgi:ZIP family zinc transporter/zinc and cadmium transporter
MAAVAIHCLLDGLPLAEGHGGGLFTWALLAHKLPEGMAVGAALRNAGFSTARVLALTLLTQAFTLVGAGAGMLAGDTHTPLLGLALALTSGAYLYLTIATLAGIGSTPRARPHGVAAGIGIVAIATALLTMGGGH